MKTTIALALASLLLAGHALAAPGDANNPSLIDLEQHARASSGFSANLGAVHPNATRSLNGLLSPIAPCQPGTTCSGEESAQEYLRTRLSSSMPRDQSEVFAMLKSYGLMIGPLGNTGVAAQKGILATPAVLYDTMVRYSDPSLAASKDSQAGTAYSDAGLTVSRMMYFSALAQQLPQFRMMESALHGCIVQKMRDLNLDQNTAIKACSGDRLQFPTRSGGGTRRSDPNQITDDRFTLNNLPGQTAATRSADINPSVAALTRSAPYSKAGPVEKAAAPGSDKKLLSDLIYKALIDRIRAASISAGGTTAITGTDPLKRLEDSRDQFKALAGDMEFTSLPMDRTTVSPSVVPTGLQSDFLTPIRATGNVPLTKTKDQKYQDFLQTTWDLLTQEAGEACRFYTRGGENFSGSRDQRGKRSYYHHIMTAATKRKLSIEGMPLTPVTWDILMWFGIQGRTFDRVEEDLTCRTIESMKSQLEAFKKKEFDPTKKDVRDMQRAFFWYAAFVAAGKTLGVYDTLESDLTEIGLQASHDDQTQLVTQAIRMVRRASGFDDLAEGGIQGAMERNVEDFSDFMEKLKRYRQGIPSPGLALPNDESKRPVEVLGAGARAG